MQRRMVLASILAMALPAIGRAETSRGVKYFGKFVEDDAPCGAGDNLRLNGFVADWYSNHLNAGGEPSLYERATSGEVLRIWRLTWLRTFHSPVVVRVEEGPGGVLTLHAVSLSGQGGYEPGRAQRTLRRPLTPTEAAIFIDSWDTSREAAFATDGCPAIGADGARWILEEIKGGKYSISDARSPDAIRLMLLLLTGWDLRPIY